ncbi:MAG: riboflavin synthase [Armatimonadetes bacterium]|nr:riboflavin synthase [Armatimonadota bacterium]
MFTGIVESLEEVLQFDGERLSVARPDSWDHLSVGESIAINGCCLTLAAQNDSLAFEVSEETLGRTTLGGLPAGTQVNLERALKVGARLGGHYVQGHIDCTGRFVDRSSGGSWRFQIPDQFAKYLVDKGSVAIDGVSLTVVEPDKGDFSVAVIPLTQEKTSLGQLTAGDAVNIEFDVLAKYVEGLLATRQ